MAYQLDPAMLDFLRQRTGGVPPPVDAAPVPPPVPVAPVHEAIDPEVMQLLEGQDAEAKDYNARQDLKEGVGRSMNYFLGRPVNPDVGTPKVDDSVRKYLLTRKLGAQGQQNPLVPYQMQKMLGDLAEQGRDREPSPVAWGAPSGMTRGEALRAGYGHAPKAEDANKIPKIPITEPNRKALLAKGIDPTGMDNSEAAKLLGTQNVGIGGLETRQSEINRDKTGDLRMGRYMDLGPSSPLIGDNGGKARFIDSAESVMDMNAQAEKLRGLIKKYGAGRDVDEKGRTQMKQIVANLRTSLKTIMALGVIAGPDMPQFVDPQISDPTLVEANVNAFFGGLGKTDYDTQLRGLAHNFSAKVKRKMDMLDVIPKGPMARQFAKARADELHMSGMAPAEIEKTLEAEGY